MILDGLADRLIALQNMIDHLKRSPATSRFMPEIIKGLANDSGTPRHDFNQLMEASNNIRTEVDLRSTREADWLWRMATHTASMPEKRSTFQEQIVLRSFGRPNWLAFHITMMVSQLQEMNIMRCSRHSINPIARARRKKILFYDARERPGGIVDQTGQGR